MKLFGSNKKLKLLLYDTSDKKNFPVTTYDR